MTAEIYKKLLMSWEVELQWKSRKIILVLDNCTAQPHLVFEKYPTGIYVSQHHIPGTVNGHGNHKS
jgi:hypothetical protein